MKNKKWLVPLVTMIIAGLTIIACNTVTYYFRKNAVSASSSRAALPNKARTQNKGKKHPPGMICAILSHMNGGRLCGSPFETGRMPPR